MVQSSTVTMQTIADSLGLSRATVSLALRDEPRVAEATRTRVRAEAVRLGFAPNRNAVRLRTQQRNVVGLVVPDITNPVVAEAAIGMQVALEEQSLIVVLSNTFDDASTQRRILRQFIEEQVAGVLLIPSLGTTPADLDPLRLAGIPAVLLNRDVAGSDLPIVRVPDPDVVGLAFHHLRVRHRADSIGYFGGIADAGPRIGRLQAFEDLCATTGVSPVYPWSVASPSSASHARQQAVQLLQSATDFPDGLIVHNDIIAIGVLRALRENGVTPSQLPLVSIDNVEISAMTNPALTAVSIDPRHLGSIAGSRLAAALTTAEYVREPHPPALVVRESCGCE